MDEEIIPDINEEIDPFNNNGKADDKQIEGWHSIEVHSLDEQNPLSNSNVLRQSVVDSVTA